MENNNTSIQIAPTNNINDVIRMGKIFFESGMFADVKSIAQAVVKVQVGAELGIPPFQAMSGVNVIAGKPSIGAGLMASKVDQHPSYDYEVLQQTDKICEIKFFKNNKVRGISKFTIEDAKKAGTKNLDKFPANMLFARAMSNGVRWYCPGVFSGPVYTPEELGEVIDTPYENVPPAPKPEPAKAEPTPIQPANNVGPDYKTELIGLLQNPVFTEQERTNISKQVNGMSEKDLAENFNQLQAVVADRELRKAIEDVESCDSEDCLKDKWSYYKDLHKDKEFILAVKTKKASLQIKTEQPQAEAPKYVYGSQVKDNLIETLKKPYFTKTELNKELPVIMKMTEEEAAEKLDYYTSLLEERTAQRAEIAQELYQFAMHNSEALGEAEVKRLSNMCNDIKIPMTALVSAKEDAALSLSTHAMD